MRLNKTLMNWGETDNSDGYGKYNCPPCQTEGDEMSYKFGFRSPEGITKDHDGFNLFVKFFQ